MSLSLWGDIDRYITDTLVPSDPILDAALQSTVDANLPLDSVSPAQGKFLQILARISGAKRILEIGTLAGYSAIWLARALPPGGKLVTIELKPATAALARKNFTQAELVDVIELHEGNALEILPALAAQEEDPFDFIFLDADKRHHGAYLDIVLKLAHKGTIIVADNVIRHGDIINKIDDPRVQGIRDFMEKCAANPRLCATALQTVGGKGHDGFAIVYVQS